jgi:hypothetical protein
LLHLEGSSHTHIAPPTFTGKTNAVDLHSRVPSR